MQKYLISLIFLLILNLALAQTPTIPPTPTGYVNDYAQLLTPAQVATLDSQLQTFDTKTSNQIAVATFDTLDGMPIEDFSIKLVEQWKIGTKQHDNGVLLLIIKNDHKIRIEVGYGLEGALTDALSDIIIRNEIAPEFRKGDYFTGIQNGLTAIMQATQGEYKGSNSEAAGQKPASWTDAIFPLIFLIIFVLLFFRRRPYSIGTAAGLGLAAAVLSGAGGGGGNNNSFSGFGGGGFGGGGASGGW